MGLPRLAQLVLVLLAVAEVGPVRDDPDRRDRRFVDERCATSSASTPWTRSSVERSTRDISDVMTMTTMKIDAILRPSGRSMMFTTVV